MDTQRHLNKCFEMLLVFRVAVCVVHCIFKRLVFLYIDMSFIRNNAFHPTSSRRKVRISKNTYCVDTGGIQKLEEKNNSFQ